MCSKCHTKPRFDMSETSLHAALPLREAFLKHNVKQNLLARVHQQAREDCLQILPPITARRKATHAENHTFLVCFSTFEPPTHDYECKACKTTKMTRLNCIEITWTTPKCCTCRETCSMELQDLSNRLRLPHKTQRDIFYHISMNLKNPNSNRHGCGVTNKLLSRF